MFVFFKLHNVYQNFTSSGCQELSLFFLKPPEAVPNYPSSVNKLYKQCQIVS